MQRLRLAVLALAAASVTVSCADSRNTVLPTSPTGPVAAGAANELNLGPCLTPAAIDQLVVLIYGPRHPNYRAITAKFVPIFNALARRDTAKAREKAFDAVDYIQRLQGRRRFRGNPPAVDQLIKAIFCLVGISYADPTNTFLILPSDQPQLVVAGDGLSGVSLPANPVSEPTLVTITKIVTVYPPGGGPLNTKLDQYPGFYEFTKQSATNAPLTQNVVVAVCPDASVPDSIFQRLRLGHGASTGFELTPQADASFLACPASTASNASPSLLHMLASLFTPRELHAATRLVRGGVGGSAGEFSPFAPVDPVLSFGGGVGGSAGEFLLAPLPPAATNAPRASAGPGTVRFAPVGPVRNLMVAPLLPGAPFLAIPTPDCTVAGVLSPLVQACRPLVTLTTRLGTPFTNVPIGWAVAAGGGTIAPQDPTTLACGAFSAGTSTTTGALGKSGVCWTTGPAAGVNTVIAMPVLGGDAVPGVTFSPTSQTFTVTASLVVPVASAVGENITYDGLAHSGSGTCSDGLTPVLTYSGGSAPVNAGTTTVTVTCGAGNPQFATVSATATIDIGQRAATATAGSGSLTLGVSVSTLPCTIAGLLPADVGSVTCTTGSGPIGTIGTYPTFAVVSPSSPVNYAVSAAGAGSVSVTPYVKTNCFPLPVTAGDSRAGGVAKGTPVAVSCVLSTSTGAQAPGASGDLVVTDLGAPVSGGATNITVLTVPNAFAPSGAAYVYTLDTGLGALPAGHLYRLVATWRDGSQSAGFLWIQP